MLGEIGSKWWIGEGYPETLVSTPDWWWQSRADKSHQSPQWSLYNSYFLFSTFKCMQITFTSRPPTFGSPQLLIIPSLPSITFSQPLIPTSCPPPHMTLPLLLDWHFFIETTLNQHQFIFSRILIWKFQTYRKVERIVRWKPMFISSRFTNC